MATMTEFTMADMEAELGADIVKRLFETEGDSDRRNPKHRAGAGRRLFDIEHADEYTAGWHKLAGTDDMRDLRAEAAGDINMGQTHRLNRMALGYAAGRRDSMIGNGFPGQNGRAADDIYIPRRQPGNAPLSKNTSGPAGVGNSKLDAARAFMEECRNSGGKNADFATRKKGRAADAEFHNRVLTSSAPTDPRRYSYTAQDARAMLPGGGGGGGGKLPAKLPGPRILPPRGARTGMPVNKTPTGLRPPNVPSAKLLPKYQQKPRTLTSGPPPLKLASIEEFFSTLPARGGLGKSKHAPPAKSMTVPPESEKEPLSLAKPVVKPPEPNKGPIASAAQLVAPKLPKTLPVVLQMAPVATPQPPPVQSVAHMSIPLTADGMESVAKKATTGGLGRSKHAPPPMAVTPPPKTPSLVSGSELSPIIERLRQVSTPIDCLEEMPRYVLKEKHKAVLEDDDMCFAAVDEEWIQGAGSLEKDHEVERYSREGIAADNTVTGGPYYMAAVIAALPHIGNEEYGY